MLREDVFTFMLQFYATLVDSVDCSVGDCEFVEMYGQ